MQISGVVPLFSYEQSTCELATELSQLIVEIGDSFLVRRTLARLESGEVTLKEAIVLLRALRGLYRVQSVLSISLSR